MLCVPFPKTSSALKSHLFVELFHLHGMYHGSLAMLSQLALVFASSHESSPLGVCFKLLKQELETLLSVQVPFCHVQHEDNEAIPLHNPDSLTYEHFIPSLLILTP